MKIAAVTRTSCVPYARAKLKMPELKLMYLLKYKSY